MNKKETMFIQLDYLDLLCEVARLLKETDNSIERQRSLYHLRQLGAIKLSATVSGDGPTALFPEMEQKQRELLFLLSQIGTESLFSDEGKEGSRCSDQKISI